MKVQKRSYDSEAARGRILRAALELFGSRGFKATTTRMIAERSGVNAALITRYFASKKGLFDHLVATAVNDLAFGELKYPAEASVEKEISSFLGQVCHSLEANLQIHRMIVLECLVNEELAAWMRDLARRHMKLLGQRLRRLDVPAARAESLVRVSDSMILGQLLFLMQATPSGKKNSAGLIEDLAELIRRGQTRS